MRARLVALAAVATVLVTAACTPDGDAPPTPTVTRTTGPISLTVGVYGPAPVISAYTTIASRFNAAHPSVTVTIKPYTDRATEMADIAATKGTTQQPDVFLADSADLPTLMQEHANQRVDGMLTNQNIDFGDGYQRIALEAFSADNALQCMPVDISPLVVYYNTNLVDLTTLRPSGSVPNADTGWRFSDFAAAATQASSGSVKGVYVEPTIDQIAPFVFSGGGKVVDSTEKPSTLTLAKGSADSSLEKLLELVRNPVITNTQAQIQRKDAVTRFKAGKLAMILGYRDLTPELRAQAGLSFDVMPIPRISHSATVSDVDGLCVRAKAAHRTTAAQFVAYVVGDRSMETLAETGYVTPSSTVAIHSGSFLQQTEQPASAEIFNTQNRFAEPLPAGATWEQVETQADQQLSALFYDPAIDPLQDRLQVIDDASKVIWGAATDSASPTPTPTAGSPSPSSSP